MAGYIRQSSFSDGDTITAALFNDEYNQLLSAFSNTDGHKHDGTTAEGPVIGLIGDAGETAPNNKVLIDTTNNYIEFYVQVSSSPVQQLYIADGAIVPVTDSDVDLGTSSLYFKDAYIDSITTTGNVAVGGNLTVTGTTTFNGGTITMGDAATDNVVFGADVDSNIIPDDDDTYDLGSSSQQWRNLYIDGTANIDSLVADTADINGGTVDGAIIGGSSAAAITGTAITGTSFVIGSADINEAELETIDGVTAGTVAASKAVVVDSNKDIGSFRNITLTGELDAGSLDVSGDVDVDGTTNLDVVDIDGAVDMASTLTVAGVVDITDTTDSSDATGDTGALRTEGGASIAKKLYVGTDLDVDGTANLDVVDIDGAVDMATTLTVGGEIAAASLDISGNVDIDGTLETDALSINSTAVTSTAAELNILDGVTASATDINLIDGITNGTVIASKAIITDANKDITGGRNITISGELDAATLDISGNADIDGTLETDALSINGTAVTSTAAELNILDGVTASAADINLIDGITNGTVIASKAIITDANKDISGGRNITISGELDAATLDISGNADIDGTLEADAITVNGTALASVIAGTTVANATTAAVATTVTITDNENTNENNAIIFTAGGDLDGGNLGLESDGDLYYNPSTGTLTVPNVSVSGTFSTVNSVTMDANNAVIFEGTTADAHETTLTSVDATADRTISLPNVSGTIPVLAAASTTQITSTPEELNILDGVTATAAELNILDGVTSTAAELNILDGVTSTAAELNVLDGITAVVGELNALDIGSTAVGTAVASKAVILDSNKDYTGIRNLTISGELDAATLDISGNVDIDGTLETDNLTIGGAQGSDGQVLTSTGSGVAWENAAGGGVAGISSSADATAITIGSDENVTFSQNISSVNNLYVADDIGHAGDADTYISFEADARTDYVGGTRLIDLNAGAVIINEGSSDVDFRVESNNNVNALLVDGGADKVTITGKVDFLSGVSGDSKASFHDAGILSAGGSYSSPTTSDGAGGLLTISMVGDSFAPNDPLAGGTQAINTYHYIPHRTGAFNTVTSNIGATTRGTIHGTIAFTSTNYTITNNSNNAPMYYRIRHMTG